jgi:hypothetical protein
MERKQYADDAVDRICEELEEGKSLILICKQADMPHRRTVEKWANGDSDFARRLREARELGYLYRAEMAVQDAKSAADPQAGRLAFDAERWYLGKLSNAFRDKPHVGVTVNVDATEAFGAIQAALDRAAAGIAGSGTSTRAVVIEGEARSVDPNGKLAGLAGPCRSGLGEDEDRG